MGEAASSRGRRPSSSSFESGDPSCCVFLSSYYLEAQAAGQIVTRGATSRMKAQDALTTTAAGRAAPGGGAWWRARNSNTRRIAAAAAARGLLGSRLRPVAA